MHNKLPKLIHLLKTIASYYLYMNAGNAVKVDFERVLITETRVSKAALTKQDQLS